MRHSWRSTKVHPEPLDVYSVEDRRPTLANDGRHCLSQGPGSDKLSGGKGLASRMASQLFCEKLQCPYRAAQHILRMTVSCDAIVGLHLDGETRNPLCPLPTVSRDRVP